MQSGRTTHAVTSPLMCNQRADRRSVATLAYISCQAIDHIRHTITLPPRTAPTHGVRDTEGRALPSQTPAPLRITISGRPTGWPTHGVLYDPQLHRATGYPGVC